VSATIDVPEVGPVDKTWVLAGGGIVAGIVGVAWWRHRQANQTGPLVADPTTGTDSTNPTYTNPNPVVSPDSTAQLPPTTDPEWSARVMAALNWLEPGYLGDILGKYLARQPLSLEEAAVVRAAWAVVGKPPSGMPIVLSTTGSTPGTPPPAPTPTPTGDNRRGVLIPADHQLAWVVGYYGVPEAKIREMNPGLDSHLARANRNGYISAKNPDKGDSVPVFGADTWIWLPA
jgi:hypothetical protein